MTKTERTIILGIDFDGAPVQTSDPLFVNKIGPLTFLDFLEIHSGLIPVQTSQLERIASFMAVLREHRGEFSFYEESWTRTPFNAARRMLEWIDAWYLHGWNGEMEYPTDSTGEKTTCILELAAL
ncbi:MAG: hypothetical protein PF693_20165, partial [Spirochaetia bacterium]|nr:hypothetical protein [Spirochaetia bacterium]